MNGVQFKFLMQFIKRMANEHRLNTSHISLCFALIICWGEQNNEPSFVISRRLLMGYSKIASKSTYHICIKKLTIFGLITYNPSYNPCQGTLVTFLIK